MSAPLRQLTDEVKYTKPNRKMYVFEKWPDCALEPQCQAILNTIHLHGPMNRMDLCREAGKVLESIATVSSVVSYHQRLLVRLKCITIYEPAAYRKMKDEQMDKEQGAEIVPSGRGGWCIKTLSDGMAVGNYATPEAAREVLRQNHFNEQQNQPHPESIQA